MRHRMETLVVVTWPLLLTVACTVQALLPGFKVAHRHAAYEACAAWS